MSDKFRVELIHPVEKRVEHHDEAGQRSLAKTLLLRDYGSKMSLSTPPLGLLRLATFTPKEIEGSQIALSIRDDIVERVSPQDWDNGRKPDLVGISCVTASSERTAHLTAEAMRRGIQVVVGGAHTTVDTDDALRTGAAVVKGAGELIWPEVLKAAAKDGLENRVYENNSPEHMNGVTLPPSSFFEAGDYFSINVLSAGEGCAYKCPFCSTKLVKGKYRPRDLDDITEEIDQLRRSDGMVIMTDDNPFMHPQADRIITRLGDGGHSWFSNISSRLASGRPDLIRLAGENGCRVLFVGIDKLEGLEKNRDVDYEKLIADIRQSGINPAIGFVLGLGDPQKRDLQKEADEVKRFLTRNRVPMIHLSSAVPYPGTEEYKSKADRLFRPPSDYDTQSRVVYHPKKMTAGEFDEIYLDLCRDLYSIPNILWRLSSVPGAREKMELFFYNLARWRHIAKRFQR